MEIKSCEMAFTGENNSRYIVVNVDKKYWDKNVYLIFETPNSKIFETKPLNSLMNDKGEIVYYLGADLLKNKGTLRIQVVISFENFCIKSSIFNYYVKASVGDTSTSDDSSTEIFEREIEEINDTQNLIDIFETYIELAKLPTTNVKNGDKVIILEDETRNNAMVVYKAKVENEMFVSWEYVTSFNNANHNFQNGTGHNSVVQKGTGNYATGANSFAIGSGTKANSRLSFSQGEATEANGIASHSEGGWTIVRSKYGHVEGQNSIVDSNGQNGHAEGNASVVNSWAGHAEGQETRVTGTAGHAEGVKTVVSGYAGHSEGQENTSNGTGSHAGGIKSVANGDWSFAHGYNCYSNATGSITFGNYLKALSEEGYETYFGTFNNPQDNIQFAVGIGTSDTDRRNGFSVLRDGRVQIYGTPVEDNDGVRLKELVLVKDNENNSVYQVNGYPFVALLSKDEATEAIMPNAKAIGMGSVAFGGTKWYNYNDYLSGKDVVTTAKGTFSFASGVNNLADGSCTFVANKDNKVYQNGSSVFGGGNKVGLTEEEFNRFYSNTNSEGKKIDHNGHTYEDSWNFNFAVGNANELIGTESFVTGLENKVIAIHSLVNGDKNTIGSSNNFCWNVMVTGKENDVRNSNTFVNGQSNYSDGINVLVSGANNTNYGNHNIIVGKYNTVNPGCAYSNLFGYYLQSNVSYQTIVGRFNRLHTYALFTIGNGSSVNSRSNAFEVYQDGRVYIAGRPLNDYEAVRKIDMENKFNFLARMIKENTR